MDNTSGELPSLLGYQLRLPSFEGPFDILLRLVERSHLAITDISLVSVTSQFLAHVASLGGAPAEVVAEFATVGSRLVLLKSRSLLPRPPSIDEEPPAGDLVRQLIEYRALKRAALSLADLDAAGLGAFARGTSVARAPDAPFEPRLAIHEASGLARALRRRLSSIPSPRSLLNVKPIVSLREMVDRILRLAAPGQPITFSDIARRCADAGELRTAFLATLVLIRRRVIDAEQPHPFGEIVLRQSPGHREFAPTATVASTLDDR